MIRRSGGSQPKGDLSRQVLKSIRHIVIRYAFTCFLRDKDEIYRSFVLIGSAEDRQLGLGRVNGQRAHRTSKLPMERPIETEGKIVAVLAALFFTPALTYQTAPHCRFTAFGET